MRGAFFLPALRRQTPLVTVAAVAPAGQSFQQVRHLDLAPSEGLNLYRVVLTSARAPRQSEEVSVRFHGRDILAVYPNPANDLTRVALKGVEGHDLTIRVIDALGRQMRVVEIPSASEVLYELETADLPRGSYLIHVQSGGVTRTLPLSVVGH